ncbi:MAG: MFS transporter [Thermodesulfobacteriota bacterium]
MKLLLLFLFWCMWFLNFTTRTIFSPLLPVIEDEFGISHALAGSLILFMSLGYAISLVLSGFLSPRMGYKRTILFSHLLIAFALMGLRYAGTYSSVGILCLVTGLGAGLYLPCAIPLLTHIFSRENWGKAIVLHDSAAPVSILSVPLLVALSSAWVPWRDLFLILGVVFLVSIAAFGLLAPSPAVQHEDRKVFSRVICRKNFWFMAVLWIFASATSLGFYQIIPLFLVKERGFALDAANSVLGLTRIGSLVIAILAGFLADRYGGKRILMIAFLTTGLSTMAVAAVTWTPALVGLLFLQASFNTAFFPVGLMAVSMMTAPSERSAFTGAVVAAGVIFGFGLTPPTLGAIADHWSFQMGILGLGFATLLSSWFAHLLDEI